MEKHTFDLIVVTIIALAGLIAGIVAMALNYVKQMERIKRQPVATNSDIAQAIEALRKEVADLRDTSTRYDVSFDTALQRMESRIAAVERRTGKIEQEQTVGAVRG